MLILSRRVEQEIHFPHLGISVRVLQVRGKIVKIGVVAPRDVQVVRPEARVMRGSSVEALDTDCECDLQDVVSEQEARNVHRRRNQMNLLQLRIDTIQSRIDKGEMVDADAMLKLFFQDAKCNADEFTGLENASNTDGIAPAIHVLVVEDSDNERGLMSYLLSIHGFIVTVARDGNEAFQQLIQKSSAIDLILMDIEMPLADGVETLCRIRSNPLLSDLQVFAVTGSPKRYQDDRTLSLWDAWFCKPVDMKGLIAKIRDDVTAKRSLVAEVH